MPTRSALTAATLLALVALGAPSLVASRDAAARGSSSGGEAPPADVSLAANARAFARGPLAFEPNAGRWPGEVRYVARGSGYALFLTEHEAVLSLPGPEGRHAVRLALAGASPTSIEAEGLMPGVVNHLVGDPDQWRTGLSQHARVRYRDAYPGIDVVFYGQAQRQIEYDIEVAPGADPSVVRLTFDGIERMELAETGELLLHTPAGTVRQHAPVSYQEIDGARQPVESAYHLFDSGEVGFTLGEYDPTLPLVIDPVLVYATFLGGSAGEFDAPGNRLAARVAVDAAGFVYAVGDTVSTDFPLQSPQQPTKAGGPSTSDLFIAKLNPTGTELVFSTYFGGSNDEFRASLAIDGSGNIVVAGQTGSNNLPAGTTNVLYPTYRGGAYDGFVAKLSANGQTLLWRIYLGGAGIDSVDDVAVDAAGDVYVTGSTTSVSVPPNEFPVAGAAFQPANGGGSDAFVTKIRGDGTALVYSTFLGGANDDAGTSIAVDAAGAAYVAGTTRSTNFPVVTPIQPSLAGQSDIFVTKISASGSQLIYSTYFGGIETPRDILGEPAERATIAVDRFGAVYVGGWTNAIDLPIGQTEAYQPFLRQNEDGFIAKIAPSGTELLYRTYLGGGGVDLVTGIAVDDFGNAHVTGLLNELPTDPSPFFPTTPDAYRSSRSITTPPAPADVQDAFYTVVNSSGSALLYSTYLGGSGRDLGLAVGVDAAGNATVIGQTESSDFAMVPGPGQVIDGTYGGLSEAFIVRFASQDPPSVSSVSPATGPASGGTLVVVSGQRFTSGATVTFGTSPATSVVVQSATQLLAVAPAGASGTAAVTVTNSDGKFGSLPDGFTYFTSTPTPPPTLSAVNPFAGRTSGGETVQLTGANFVAGATVRFGLALATITALAPNAIDVVTPAGTAGLVDVRVTNPDGQFALLTGGFEYFSELTDSDGDGLPDWYENLHTCLSPIVPDAQDDPDGDGATNLQEYFDGTNPCVAETHYFAEGATLGIFETRFAVFNPDPLRTATLRFNFQLLVNPGAATETATTTRTLAPLSRLTLSSDEVAALTNRSFSTELRSNLPLVADRQMTWDRTTAYGSHAETSIPAPNDTWYVAEGATGPFRLYYLIQNPNDTEVDVTVRYLPGFAFLPSLEKVYRAPAFSRINILVNDELFDTNNDTVPDTAVYADAPLSAVFTAPQPIIVERAMYLDNAPGRLFNAGHNSAGVTEPATTWFLAEGATGVIFDLYVLIANPTDIPADVRLTFLLPNGTTYTKTYDGVTPGVGGVNPSIAPNSRFTEHVNILRPDGALGTLPLATTSVSTIVESLNNVPIIVERAMWWPRGGLTTGWHEGHNSVGITSTGTKWALAEGEMGGPREAITFVLVANTSPFAGRIRARFIAEDGTESACSFLIGANTRLNVNETPTCFANMTGRRFATIVESESTGAGLPQIVVERAIYWSIGAEFFAAGSNSVATKLQ